MIRTLMNTAKTARIPTCSRTAGNWLGGVFSSLMKPATKKPGMWMSAKNGATMTLASSGPRRSWMVCCMKPVQAVSSHRLTSTKGTRTPGKNTVKSSDQFRARDSSGDTPRKGMAPSNVRARSPKSARRYQRTPTRHLRQRRSRSRTPSLPSLAAATKNAGSASPKMDIREPNTRHGSANGKTPNPLSESSRGSMMVHENKNAMSRKATTGWRATRRLSDGEVVGCRFSVAVDTICLLPRSVVPDLRAQARRSGEVGSLHSRLGPYSHRLDGGSAQDTPCYPSPAYRYQHRSGGHRRRGGLCADRHRVHETEDVHQHGRGSPQRPSPLRQDSRAPDGHPQEHIAYESQQDGHDHGHPLQGTREAGGQLVVLLHARQVGLSLLGRGEGGDPSPGQDKPATKNGYDHGPQPQASGAASGEVGPEGNRAEDREDGAELTEEQVLEHVAVGGDEAGESLVVGVGVGLGIEAREEGHNPIEGQTQQADAYPPGDVRRGHIGNSFPFGSWLLVGVTSSLRGKVSRCHESESRFGREECPYP